MLAAAVEHHARAQLVRQREILSQAKLLPTPPPWGPEPVWEGLLAVSVGLLHLFTDCAGPLGTSLGMSCCCSSPATLRSCLKVAQALSSCGESSRSPQELQLQTPGDLPRAYCSRAEIHGAQAESSPP